MHHQWIFSPDYLPSNKIRLAQMNHVHKQQFWSFSLSLNSIPLNLKIYLSMDNYKNQAVMLYYQIWEAICPLQWNFHLTWDFDSDFEVAKIRAQMPLCLLDIQFSSWFGRFVMGTLMNWQSSWPSFLGFHSQQCQWPRETPNHDLLIEAKTSLKVNTFWATTQWPRALSKSPLPNISKCIHPKKPLNYGVGIRLHLDMHVRSDSEI